MDLVADLATSASMSELGLGLGGDIPDMFSTAKCVFTLETGEKQLSTCNAPTLSSSDSTIHVIHEGEVYDFFSPGESTEAQFSAQIAAYAPQQQPIKTQARQGSGEGVGTFDGSWQIYVDDSVELQEIVGFGAAWTDAAVTVLDSLSEESQKKVMQDLFAPITAGDSPRKPTVETSQQGGEIGSIGLSLVRHTIGQSDLTPASIGEWSYVGVVVLCLPMCMFYWSLQNAELCCFCFCTCFTVDLMWW